ncbi:RAG1-activating protein 1-like protein [Zootermopsis nevadensis]|uniref:Sugar transporter SWEET1 n=2 Tax=Zootermopsis nevadensis TaxID=136037 RepID=A0A067R7P8_ZOONE|nr:RAG1-activating protein 1-like protein [Zootermopsis nevadensis]
MEGFKDVIATSASFCTILQFFTGILVCQKYVRNGTTGDSSPFPFVSGFLSSCIWLRYGFLLQDPSLIIVNTIGTSLQLAYVVTFYFYTIAKSVVVKQMLGVTAVLLALLSYTQYETDLNQAKTLVGFVASLMTVLFFAAPLTMLAHVLSVKSVDSLPLPLIMATFVCCLQWLIYGYLLEDPFIQV